MTLDSLLNVARQGPEFCSTLLPTSPHHALYAALICGIPLSASEEKRIFLDTGLIHILVVSGAHLIFLERLTLWLPARARLSVLGVFCWLTGFGAPVVKAFLRRALEPRLHGWTTIQCEGAAVAAALLLFPPWIVSRSFLMSWTCALAFALPPLLPRPVDASVKVFILLYAFSAASPLTVLWNALVAPFVGELLFPASLTTIALPALTPLVDQLWSALLWILELGPQGRAAEWFWPARQLLWIPLFTHIFLLMMEVRWRRARAFLL